MKLNINQVRRDRELDAGAAARCYFRRAFNDTTVGLFKIGFNE